ncbi:MAG: segregation/condensation protein A [Bacilli bacterium]|nr:segregation/condensation protein A [Bacilli bacterium]MDD3895504.1 segregation/condensation protein A [Bacilli bacterium]MDD4407558.1 segregation/condensation protein A [Bacilli bacterium]
MTFTINEFEGPLDLLLHLIKANKMDIYNIDISRIIKEYLDFIQNNELSIDVNSEYLVMASELIHLKSKLLLNKNEEDEEEYEFNNPDDLANRLLEYEKIKKVAEDFKKLEEKRSEIYTKIPSSLDEYRDNPGIYNSEVSLNDLLNAFELFLKRQKLTQPINTKITKKELNVEERCIDIRNKLKNKNGKIKFLELFDNVSKSYVVVTFLSILNMAKNGEIKIIQKNNFNDIFIEGSDQK